MHHNYDFTSRINRRETGSLKWDKYENKNILPFWVADMDFYSPPEVISALQKRVEHGVYGYTLPYPSVIKSVIEYMRQSHGVEVKKEWIVWMPGLVPALNTASRAFESPGDGVLTNTPVYPPFLSAPEWQNKQLISVPLKLHNDKYTFDFPAMEKAITEKTKLFILCNPHNPVGRVFNKTELSELVQFCKNHKLILISDEIHCDLIFQKDVKHNTILSMGDWAHENSLTLMAPSKTYNIPGLSCAFIIIPNPQLRLPFQRASRGMITEINCFGYVGCEASYRYGEEWRQQLLAKLKENYELTYSFIKKELPSIHMIPMEATYLAWLDVRSLELAQPDTHFESHGIGLSNGALFGAPGFLRLNFGCPTAVLMEGLDRLKKAYDAV